MPWDQLEPRAFKAFDKELDGIFDWDHVNRQLIQAEGARRGATESGAVEQGVT